MPRARFISLAALVAVTACATAQWHLRETSMRHRLASQVYEHIYYLPPVSALKVLSLGQREAVADLLWARGLIYLGDEAVRNRDASHVFQYARAVVALDPYFSRAYRTFAITANSRPGLTDDEAIERIRESLEFLEAGVRVLPDDAELAWDTGATYAYTLAPRLTDVKEYREAKRRGIEHMRAATLRGAGPTWAGMANAATLVKLGQTEQAIAHLQELYAITNNPDVRAEIENNLGALRSAAFIEGLRAVSADLSRNHARDFPYVSETLYLLLGSRPPFDGAAFVAHHFDPSSSAPAQDDTDPAPR